MRWVAPTEKDEANHALEKRLWAAADQFRANSGLKAGQYSTKLSLAFFDAIRNFNACFSRADIGGDDEDVDK